MTRHTFEMAPSGRSKCRGCGRTIAKGELRFGERLDNPFGDGDMTHWLHPRCAAHRRPEALLEGLAALDYPADDAEALQKWAGVAADHRRLPRLGAGERAPSGRARCRHCRELIEQDAWRVPLIFVEEGQYSSSGFIHAACVMAYAETDAVWDALECFAHGLAAAELASLKASVMH